MLTIRLKDKLFVAALAPVALTAAYIGLWRNDAAREAETLARECDALVDPADYPAERQLAEKRLATAQQELARERALPRPESQVRQSASSDPATRELAVLETFRTAGLAVVRSAAITRDNDNDPALQRARRVLAATGVCPDPQVRAYVLEGPYPQLLAALKQLSAQRLAVIPASVEMPSPGNWRLALVL